MYANKRLSAAKQIKAPGWFMLIATLALLWNLAGLAAFWSDLFMPETKMAAMPEARRALFASTPVWAWAAYGLAVIAGTLGALALMLRKAVAAPLFMLSLAGVLVQMFHAFFLARAAAELGPTSLLMPLVIIALSIGLLVLAMKARNQGWLT